MLPAARVSQEVLQSRLHGFRMRVGTSHWPNVLVPWENYMEPDNPRDLQHTPDDVLKLVCGQRFAGMRDALLATTCDDKDSKRCAVQ